MVFISFCIYFSSSMFPTGNFNTFVGYLYYLYYGNMEKIQRNSTSKEIFVEFEISKAKIGLQIIFIKLTFEDREYEFE